MIEAVGFDLGDTLIYYKDVPLSWGKLYRDALRNVMESCKIEVSEEALNVGDIILSKYNTRINPREEEVEAEWILKEILCSWDIKHNKYLDKAIDSFFEFFQRRSIMYEDTIEVLTYLRNKGIKIGILTDVPYGMNRKFVKKDVIGFYNMIDCLVTSVEVGYRKPVSNGYQFLAERLNVNPKNMIYVGNERKDIVGAKSQSMVTVLINRDNQTVSYGEDYKIKSLRELYNIL